MANIDEIACEKAGLDYKKVKSITNRISKAAKEAEEMHLCVFGGSGSGSLRFTDPDGKGNIIVASLDGNIDGGDGASLPDEDGIYRGETI